MTLLKEKDILGITETLHIYNEELQRKTGTSLSGIALHAIGKSQEDFYSARWNSKIAVIPVTSGEGVIGGFCETVKSIIEFNGFSSFITVKKDISGIEEAYKRKADVIFIADDDKFIAINPFSRKVVDNGEATGKGYASALDLISGGVRKKEVLLIGAGPVGFGAAGFLAGHGAGISVFDIDLEKSNKLKKSIQEVKVIHNLENALPKYNLILDATPAAEIIKENHITPKTHIAAPGIPLGVDASCIHLVSERLIHDVLEIGVATMLFDALSD